MKGANASVRCERTMPRPDRRTFLPDTRFKGNEIMDKKVKIYTTPGCNYCRQAKVFLEEKGIDFESVDVSADKEAMQEMRKLTEGGRSVPVIRVCDQVLVGFDRKDLEKALECLGA